MAFPVASAFVLLRSYGLNALAQGRFLGEVLLFLGADVLEMLLMTLVDDRRRGLEACPYLLSELLGHRTCLAILLMQLLQLVERAYHIGLFGEFLRSLAETRLELEVLLEVVLTRLAIEFQQVVVLLHVQLVVAPQLAGVLRRHALYLLPLLLQFLEFIV